MKFFIFLIISFFLQESFGQNKSPFLQTSVEDKDCKAEVDRSDPNESTYFVCKGLGGYSVISRRVDSGKGDFDIATPESKKIILNFQYVVTKSMFAVSNKIDWLVSDKNEKKVEAMVTQVHVHDNLKKPEKITHSLFVIVKFTPKEICISDKIKVNAESSKNLYNLVKKAILKPCLDPLKPTKRSELAWERE